MSRRTKKVGSTGRFGVRYGVKVRYRTKSVDTSLNTRGTCPQCQHSSVSRVKSGIWKCSRCSYTFAAGAYSSKTRSHITEE
ncbi:MAG: transposase [Thermoplasmata archaeon]|nr:transposase [Thermoplasmata archaeon]